MKRKTQFNCCLDRKMASDVNIYKFPQRGCSSKGRALVSQARGTGMDAPHLQLIRKDRKSGNKRYGNLFWQIEKKTLISTSNTQLEASETPVLNEKAIGAPNRHCLPHKDVEGNTVLLTWESKTLSEINSSVGPHQRGSSTEEAIHWLVRNKWIDDPHRHSQN